MSKLNRFFAVCLLITSMSVVAFADGGVTQGPSIYSEPPPPGADTVSSENSSSTVLDALKTAESMTVWLLTEVF